MSYNNQQHLSLSCSMGACSLPLQGPVRRRIKVTATPRVPEWASGSISYHIAGPSLDDQQDWSGKPASQAQARLLKDKLWVGAKPRPQFHSSLEGLAHQQRLAFKVGKQRQRLEEEA